MEKLGYSIGIILLIVVFSLFMALPVMLLWNHALVPAVDGVNNINFWQSIGILFLSSILFKTNIHQKKD